MRDSALARDRWWDDEPTREIAEGIQSLYCQALWGTEVDHDRVRERLGNPWLNGSFCEIKVKEIQSIWARLLVKRA